ncbi:MAG: PQQ-dependent sugar dehydrogenase [Actinomycetota bacterium]
MKRAARAFAAAAVFALHPGGASAQAPAPDTVAPQLVADDLEFPTNMAVSPDGRVFFTEKDTGRIRIMEDGKVLEAPFAELRSTHNNVENGLLGIALHPDFPDEPWVYVYYSSADDDTNHLARIPATGNVGGTVEDLMTLLPIANAYHNGGDLAFGPDGKLYVTVGDAHESVRAQDPDNVGGKILRLNDDGSIPDDNPFGPDNPVYSLGHRNSFGICFDAANGTMWETENGPGSNDEINRIEAGGNYGWPQESGASGNPEYVAPVIDFLETIVPTGCLARDGTVIFGDFGSRLHLFAETRPQDRSVASFPSGITDLQFAPDGSTLVSTDDSIWRLDPFAVQEDPGSPGGGLPSSPAPAEDGAHTVRTIGFIAGGFVLLVIIAGGLWFRAIQRREGGP